MTDQRKIKAGEAVKDIRSGMTDSQLMEKYKISAIGLRQLFKQLLEAKAIQFSELRARNAPYEDAADLDDFRSSLRDQVTFPLAIYEEIRRIQGDIRYFQDRLENKGINARTGEVKTFVVPAEHSDMNSPVVFQAVCKWPGGKRLRRFWWFRSGQGLERKLADLQHSCDLIQMKPESTDSMMTRMRLNHWIFLVFSSRNSLPRAASASPG